MKIPSLKVILMDFHKANFDYVTVRGLNSYIILEVSYEN